MTTHHHNRPGRTFPTAAAWQAERAARPVRPAAPDDTELTEDDLKLLRPLARRVQIADLAEQLGLPPIPTKENNR